MKPKTLGIIVGVLVVIFAGFFLFRLPQPLIELKPETLFSIGPLKVTNTIFTAWIMIIVILLGTVLGTRRLTMVPSGFQNLFEAVMEGFANIVNGVAGEKNGRRFFPVVFVFLLYIVVNNWTALTPVFNIIGKTQNLREEVQLDATGERATEPAKASEIQGWFMEKSGLTVVPLFKKTKYLKVEFREGMTFRERADLLDKEIRNKYGLADGANVEEYLDEQNLVYGLIAPFFRGVNTDLNAPLSYAIWSAIFVEFWGITALGLRGYGSKFFNLKGIGTFVGILELVSEFARLISFTFRLFGNIFAGEVLLFMMGFLVPFVLVDVFYGLELFVGLIQGFVFAMLTLVFGVMAVSGHGDHEEDGHDGEGAHGGAHEVSHA